LATNLKALARPCPQTMIASKRARTRRDLEQHRLPDGLGHIVDATF
jgi:hypothetical protein